MNLTQKFNAFKKKKGLYQFTIRSIIFLAIAMGLYLSVFLWIRHLPFFIQYLRIDEGFYLPWLTGLRKTDFLNAAAFAAIAFVLWNRDSISQLKVTKRQTTQTIVYGALAVLFFVGHYAFKFWIGQNLILAQEHALLVTLAKLGFLLVFAIFLAMSVYTTKFLKKFMQDHWKSIVFFMALGAVYFFLIQFFQLIWYELSYFVTIVLRELLELMFDDVYFSPGTQTHGPRLGAAGFNVGISNECSGIDSLLLFISLYTILLALDWKRMHVKRMFILLVPGIIGTVAYNILRIYLLMLVGIFIDPEFAVDVFHTNIGWILFLGFFIVFWHFGSKWVYKPKKVQKKNKKKKSK